MNGHVAILLLSFTKALPTVRSHRSAVPTISSYNRGVRDAAGTRIEAWRIVACRALGADRRSVWCSSKLGVPSGQIGERIASRRGEVGHGSLW